MGNSSTKLAEKCMLLHRDEVPIVASSFKLVSKNSDRIKEDELMVRYHNIIFYILNLNVQWNRRKTLVFKYSRVAVGYLSTFLYKSCVSNDSNQIFCLSDCLFIIETMGLTNGSTISTIYHKFFIWAAGESVVCC